MPEKGSISPAHTVQQNKNEDLDCDIRGTLENILSEQISRLLSCGTLEESQIGDVLNILKSEGLMPDQIDLALAHELRVMCTSRYDDVMPTSNRLGGWGYSMERIQTHMERELKSKLSALSTVLRTRMSQRKE